MTNLQTPVVNSGSGSTVAGNLGSAPAAGTTIVVVATRTSNTTAFADPSGWGVSSWTIDRNSGVRRRVTVFRGTSDGSTGNGTVPAGFTPTGIAVYNLPAGVTLDGSNSADGQSASPSPGSVTPTASADALAILGTASNVANTSGPTNGFTGVGALGATGAAYLEIASASGSYTSGFGNGNAFAVWDAVLVVYASGSPPPTQIPPIARGQLL